MENSDLLTQLTTAEQMAKEDEMAFLNRLIKLKERILYEGRLKISADTLMEMVLKSLESGLANERIVTRLLPLFSQPNVSDNILKQEMSKAMRSCTLRKDKKQNSARVAAVEEAAKKSKEDEFIKMAKVLHEDVAEVKQVTQRFATTPAQYQQQFYQRDYQSQQQLQQQKQPQEYQQQLQLLQDLSSQSWFRKKLWKCKDCILSGTTKPCTHCIRCSTAGHQIKDCPEKENDQSNSNRSLSRK